MNIYSIHTESNITIKIEKKHIFPTQCIVNVVVKFRVE